MTAAIPALVTQSVPTQDGSWLVTAKIGRSPVAVSSPRPLNTGARVSLRHVGADRYELVEAG